MRRLDHAGPRLPLAATRIRKPERVGWAPPGPYHPGHPDTDARPRRLVTDGPRPPVAATRKTKPGELATKDHGLANPYQDGSPDSWLVPYRARPKLGDPAYQEQVDHGLNILGRQCTG